VALVGWELLLSGAATVTFRLRCVFFLPLLALAADPLMNFISRKIWMDNLLAGTSALALVFAWLSSRRSSAILPAIAAGLFAALACSLKITAAIVLPVMALVLIFSVRRSWRAAAWALIPAVVVLLAWTAWFHHRTGSWLPWWMKPDEAFLRSNPFVAASVGQSPLFYLWQLLLCCPFAVVLIVSSPWQGLSWQSVLGRMSVLWILLVVAAFTFIGLGGFPKETRYIAPAIPAVYWLFYARYHVEDASSIQRNDRLFVLFLLAAFAGAMLSGYYLLIGQYDEIVSPLKLLGG
jgi:4-amino-4-deoxy-L-arabinose transferase-like glycosyltransferase